MIACRALLAAAMLGASACAITVDEGMLLHPVRSSPVELSKFAAPGLNAEKIVVEAKDGAPLRGVLLTRPEAHTLIIYFGGNLFTVERFGPALARALAPLDANILILDHRGYGQSGGAASLTRMQADAAEVVDAAKRLRPNDLIIVHGQSLGSFMAGAAARNRAVDGVVLESSATTTEEWVEANLGPVQRRLSRVTIAPSLAGQGNLANVSAIRAPTLFIVGERDRTTPPRLTRKLYDASPLDPSAKRLAIIPGAGHDDALKQPIAVEAYGHFLAIVERHPR